jgi:MbtH protein
MSGLEDVRTYVVVANEDTQYSIWPKHNRLPDGWRAVGKEGRREQCLQYIELVWTDMRPAGLRTQCKNRQPSSTAMPDCMPGEESHRVRP